MNYADIIAAINELPFFAGGRPAELDAKIESDGPRKGLVRIEVISDSAVEELVADVIESGIVGLPLECVESDESSSVAWYRFTEDVGIA